MTTAGHYITCIGYVKGQHTLIFNDSYGNKQSGYPNENGAGVYYDWPGYNNGYANLTAVDRLIYARGGVTDTTAPTIAAFSVTPTTVTLGQSFSMNYTVSDSGGSGLKEVVFRRTSGDGTANDPGWQDIQTATASGNGPVSGSFSDTPLSVGTYWYGMGVYDNANNGQDERGAGLGPLQRTVTTPDTTPPALTITSPADGATVTSASLSVSGTASDSGLGNNGILSVTVNGASASGGTAAGTGTANWSATVTLVSGVNTITVVAKDTLNNSTQKVVSVTYNPPDTTPPALTITSPANGAVVTSASLAVSGTASDSGLGNNGISSVTVNGASASGGTASGTATAYWSATVTLVSGQNTITVIAKDTLNNSTQKVVSVTYNPPETTPPALTIISPADGAVVTSSSLPVSGTASDSGFGNNGISSVTVNGTSASGGTASGAATANWSATVTLVSGVNTITVVAKDTLNNSTQKVVSVTYNAPTTTPAITSPTPGSTLISSAVTFQWSSGTGVTNYFLYVGSTVGAYDIYGQSAGLSLSTIVSGIPTDGRTLYVRLWWAIAGTWQYTDYTYTASGSGVVNPAMTSPVSGSTLASSSATFQWNGGTGVSDYVLYVGSSFDAYDIIEKDAGLSTSATVTGIPTDGRTLYVRLWWDTSVGWQFTDYTYKAFTQTTQPCFGGSSVSGGKLQSTLSGLSTGATVVLQVSSDLKTWTPIQTNTVNGSTLSFTNSINPAMKNQFFRAMIQQN